MVLNGWQGARAYLRGGDVPIFFSDYFKVKEERKITAKRWGHEGQTPKKAPHMEKRPPHGERVSQQMNKAAKGPHIAK